MRSVAVRPGIAESLHVRDVRRPSVDDVPDGRGVLVRMLRIGLCGTDREIIDAEFGEAPAGDDYLIIGHESLGRVEAVADEASTSLRPGALVVATVRRPGSSVYDAIGLQDMSTADDFPERGIRRAHGFLAESCVDDADYLVRPAGVARVGRRAPGAAEHRREGDPPGIRDPAPAAGLAAAPGRPCSVRARSGC